MSTIEVLVPTAVPRAAQSPRHEQPATIDGVRGRRIGIRHDKLWVSFTAVAQAWAALLEADGAEVELWCSDDRIGEEGGKVTASFHDFLSRIDAGIFGLGSCGSCTMLTVADALELRARDLPSVPVVTEHFVTLGNALIERAGWSTVDLAVLPYPLEGRSDEDLGEIARQTYPAVLACLGVRS